MLLTVNTVQKLSFLNFELSKNPNR